MFEYEIKLPFESRLTLGLYDRRTFESKLIGSTEIDLENRLLANCYATCGLQKNFDNNGWRDIKRPSEILMKLCHKFKIIPVEYNKDRLELKEQKTIEPFIFNLDDEKKKGTIKTSKMDDKYSDTYLKEYLAFKALNNWEKVTKVRLS